MNRTEFMDLLRYYFRRVSPSELAEILSDYEAHFEEGKKAGLSEEEICRELGSPKAVYEMYLHEGMIHEQEETQAPAGRNSSPDRRRNWPDRPAASPDRPWTGRRRPGPSQAPRGSPVSSAPHRTCS